MGAATEDDYCGGDVSFFFQNTLLFSFSSTSETYGNLTVGLCNIHYTEFMGCVHYSSCEHIRLGCAYFCVNSTDKCTTKSLWQNSLQRLETCGSRNFVNAKT